MAFNQAYQAIIGEIGHLALGACGITIGSTAMGHFHDAGFSIDSTNKIVKSGYPQRPICSMVESITARAYVSLDELGSPAVKGLLTDIVNSLSANSAPPTRDVSMEVFRPVGSNVIVNFNDAALLQQFELSLGNDFNQVRVEFEAVFPDATDLASSLSFSDAGPISYTAPSWLLSCGNVSVGFPKISVGGTDMGSLQSATIRLSTNYKRVESGFPRLLKCLVPLDYSLDIEFVSEEFTAAALSSQLAPGTVSTISIAVPTYDGSALIISVPNAAFVSGGPQLKQDDWSGVSWKYTGLAEMGAIATIS